VKAFGKRAGIPIPGARTKKKKIGTGLGSGRSK
jgi:hypothetical protein